LMDTDILKPLPNRELKAGFGEIVKYGIIQDPALLPDIIRWWSGITTEESQALMRHLIRRSCEIKADVVVADERETTDLRAMLNYGHTVGHALEAVTDYKRFKHGEAVAMGMMAAAHIGEAVGITPPGVRPALSQALIASGLPRILPSDIALERILKRPKEAKRGLCWPARWETLPCIGI
jgi:3-dehydroquinate synthase